MNNTELFNKNIGLVYHVYNKLDKNDFVIRSKEDMIQEGNYALWNALLTYDKTKDVKLSHYACTCIRNAMLKYIRKNQIEDTNISMDQPIDDTEELYVKDMIATEVDFESIQDLKNNIIEKYKNSLIKKRAKIQTVALKASRANILLDELILNPDVTIVSLQDKYNINRTLWSNILSELRHLLKEDYPYQFNRFIHKTF